MSLILLGTFSNSFLLVVLRDFPDIFASTYYVLLANLCFSNLARSILLKPISAIFTGYAYATERNYALFSFCQPYAFLTGSLRMVAPWTSVGLIWNVFVDSKRKFSSIGISTEADPVR